MEDDEPGTSFQQKRARGSSSAMAEDRRRDKDEKTSSNARKVICGLVFILISDFLVCPSGIIITYWYPGISFASGIYALFTGVIILLVGEKSLNTSLASRLRLVISFASFLCSSFQAVWSILLAVKNETLDIMEWLTIGAGGVWAIHFLILLVMVIYISHNVRDRVEAADSTKRRGPPRLASSQVTVGRKPGDPPSNRGTLPHYDDID